MEEYFKLPNWLKEKKDIKSRNIEIFLKNIELSDNAGALEYLRDYYKNGKENFISLLDELALRGVEFQSSKPNNVLPTLKFEEEEELILVNESSERFKNFDFENFKISNFITRFQVENDLFFDKVPLRGFIQLNKNINLEKLKKEIEEIGFIVKNSKDIKSENIDIKSKPLLENKNNFFIEECFFENVFSSFREFCQENNIVFVSDISKEDYAKIGIISGMGVTKLERIKDRLIEVLTLINEEEKIKLIFPDFCSSDNEKNFLVENYFQENKYNKLKEFLIEKKIKRIEHITLEDIEEFKNKKGIGVGKYIDAKNKLEEILKLKTETMEKNDEKIFKINDEALQEIGKFKITEYISFFDDEKIDSNLEDLSLKIAEIIGMSYKDLEEFGINRKILNYIKNYRTIDEIFEKIKFSDREKAVFEMRYLDKMNYVQIGEHFSVSRARIEQMLSKTKKIVFNFLNLYRFNRILKINFSERKIISYEKLNFFIGEHKIFLEFLAVENDPSIINYYKPTNNFYFEAIDEDKIKNFIENLPNFFEIDDYLDEIYNVLELSNVVEIELDDLDDLLKYYGYEKIGSYFKRKNITNMEIIELIFDKFIPENIKLDEESRELINGLSRKYFGIDIFGEVIRNFDSVLERIETLVLVDQLTYTHISNFSIPEHIILDMEKFIEEALITKEFLSVNALSEKYTEYLSEKGFKNKYAISSLIRVYMEGKFKVNSARTGDIYKVDSRAIPRTMQLKQAIEQHPNQNSKFYAELLNWQEFKVMNTVIESKDLYYDRNHNVGIIFEAPITKEETEEIKKFIKNHLKDEHSTLMKLLNEMKFSLNMSKIIEKYNFQDLSVFQFYLKNLMPEIKFNRYFMYTDKSRYKNFREVLTDKFRDEVERTEVFEFIRSYDYAVSTSIEKLIRENVFMETDSGKILIKEIFSITSLEIQEVISYISELMLDKEYISLNKISGYRKHLPKIEWRWNPHLIKSVLCDNGFRAIYRKNNDYRYDKVILVREKSYIENMENLIYHILKNEYGGNLQEGALIDYLLENEIINCNTTPRRLPYEIYESEKIKIDEIGVITLK